MSTEIEVNNCIILPKFYDFINLTQVHNFTVNAQDIFYLRSTSVIYRKFYRNLSSTNADNETFCAVLHQTLNCKSLTFPDWLKFN